MSVLDAVDRDLSRLPDDLAESAFAETARALAREIDSEDNSATSKSMCARELREVMGKLRELAPPEEKKGKLHDIKSGRSLRLAGGKPGA